MLRYLCSTLLTSCLLSSTAFADEPIKGRAETNLRMGHERSIFMTELWVPFAQSEKLDNVLYGSLRMMGDDQDNREGNLGIGYRHVIDSNGLNGVAGIHGWLDRRITARGSKFHQITTGVEWLGKAVDVRLNGYIPLSDKREITIPNANPQGPELAGTSILVDTNGTILEEPQHGIDLELGLELGQYSDFIRDHTDRFHIYAGGYYFDGPNTEDVSGWRTRFTSDVTENIQFGTRFQRDDVRGSQGFLEATFRFPFGHKKSYRKEGISARLDESPERDIDIVTNEVVTDSGDRIQVLNVTTGTAQEVLHVDNTAAGGGDGSAESPFNTLAAAQTAASAHTIIYVTRGDGTDTNQDQGIVLNKVGQQLIGSGIDFYLDVSQYRTANGQALNTPTLLVAEATTAPVISNGNVNGDGITVSADSVTVEGITVDGSNRDGIVVQANGASASAQNVSIQNVTTQNNRHGIYIHGTNDGSVSAMVQNTVTISNNQHGIAVYDDTDGTFTADLGGGSMGSTGNNVLAGNTLEDLAVEYDGRALSAMNNWWGQASGPDTDTPDIGIDPQIYYGAPLNDGLVGHWTYDTEWTTNTTAYDRSGNDNDGAFQGGLSLADQVTGQNRQALDFDGAMEGIQVGDAVSLNIEDTNATWSAWIYPRNAGDIFNYRQVLFDKANAGGGTGGIYANITNNRLCIFNGGNACGSINISNNQWYRIDVVKTAGTTSFYVDGVLDGVTRTWNGSAQMVDLGIGFDVQTAGRFWTGNMDDVRIYNDALDASEILELNRMNISSSVDTSGFLTTNP